MDKRLFSRQRIAIKAIIRFANGPAHNCLIREFSHDGLLISLDQPAEQPSNLKIDQPALIDFSLKNQPVTLRVNLAHITGAGLGLRLTEHNPADLSLLQQAAQQQQNEAIDSLLRATPQLTLNLEQRRQLIQSTNRLMRSYLDNRFEAFFQAIDRALFEAAEQQRTHTDQQRYLDLQIQLRALSQRLTQQTVNSLCRQASEIAEGQLPASAAQQAQPEQGHAAAQNSLSLVAKDAFENWLVVRMVISRAEQRLQEPLLALQVRIEAAFAMPDQTRIWNPYSPAAIALSFADAIDSLAMTLEQRKHLFQLFDDVLMQSLDKVYAPLNQLFMDAGVLADIDISAYLATQRLAAQGAVDVSPEPTRSAAGPVPAQAQLKETGTVSQSAFSTASRLLSVERQLRRRPGHAATVSAMVSMPPEQLQTTLQQLQQAVLQGRTQLESPGALRQFLQSSVAPGQRLGSQEQDSVEMVESLFEHIVHNGQILEDLRSELRKLEIPLLKVMLKDPELFSAEHHPARQAINQIARLADQRSINVDDNRQVVIEAIRTLLADESDNNEAFGRILSGLDERVQREQQLFERNLRRVTEACEGQQRINQANALIEQELTALLANHALAEPILALIDNGWKELMRLSYIREGVGSLAWEMPLVVLDQLIVRTVPGQWDEKRLRFSAKKLMNLISKGLSKIPDSTARHKDVISDLDNLLRDPENTEVKTRHFIPANAPAGKPDATTEADPLVDKDQQRWRKRARQLQPGQWLERHSQGKDSRLYYLAWTDPDGGLMVFCNHRGSKAEEMPLELVAELLRNSGLTLLKDADSPALEQGLDSLVQTVYDKLAIEAAMDPLTGLKTRREFIRALGDAVSRARDGEARFALLFMDVMQFKLVNNTCGYEAGDQLLQSIATTIRDTIGNTPVAGRVGVDQFAMILPVDSQNEGFRLAVALKSAIELRRFVSAEHSFAIACAMSMIAIDKHSPEPMELLRSIETVTEMSKKSGHRDIQIIKPGDTRFRERDEVISWVTRITRALDENRLKVRCQKIAPIADASAANTHYEILLTVVDEHGEHLAPADFIKAAEEFNRMGAVDRWVIETVLRWMDANPEQLAGFGGFSVNLSGCSLNDESFLDFLFELLVSYNVPRDKLIFEITETAAIDNLADAADFINEMKEIGCRFSLDDFGSGQSSYAYLKRLPVDFIKIDGAFIRNIAEDNFDFALVKSITEMGHFLGKKIIAEYVSSVEILEIVSQLGVDYAQGFHVGKPMLLEQLLTSDIALEI